MVDSPYPPTIWEVQGAPPNPRAIQQTISHLEGRETHWRMTAERAEATVRRLDALEQLTPEQAALRKSSASCARNARFEQGGLLPSLRSWRDQLAALAQ